MTFIATRRATLPRLWTPRDIGVNVSAWYDGADLSTISFNGANVSRWSDKSGSSNHLVQATTAAQPNYNTGGGVGFASNSIFLATSGNASIPIGSSPRSIFYVYSIYSGRNTDAFILQWGNGSGAGWWAHYCHASTSGTGIDPILIAGASYSSGIAAAYNTSQVASCVATASTVQANINGNAALSSSSLSYSTTAGPLYIARNYDGTRPFNGILFEAIILNTATSPALTKIVEGYLAWKWGSQSLLPAGHSYKLSRPRVSA